MATGKKNWMASAVKRPGALTQKAKAAGAYHNGKIDASFLQPKKGDSTRTKRQKALARTFRKSR